MRLWRMVRILVSYRIAVDSCGYYAENHISPGGYVVPWTLTPDIWVYKYIFVYINLSWGGSKRDYFLSFIVQNRPITPSSLEIPKLFFWKNKTSAPRDQYKPANRFDKNKMYAKIWPFRCQTLTQPAIPVMRKCRTSPNTITGWRKSWTQKCTNEWELVKPNLDTPSMMLSRPVLTIPVRNILCFFLFFYFQNESKIIGNVPLRVSIKQTRLKKP